MYMGVVMPVLSTQQRLAPAESSTVSLLIELNFLQAQNPSSHLLAKNLNIKIYKMYFFPADLNGCET